MDRIYRVAASTIIGITALTGASVSRSAMVQNTGYSPELQISTPGCYYQCPATQTITGPITDGFFNQQVEATSNPNILASLNSTVSSDGSSISATGTTIGYTGGNIPYGMAATSQLGISFTLSDPVNYSLQLALPVGSQPTASSSVLLFGGPSDEEFDYEAVNQNGTTIPPYSATGILEPGQYVITLSASAFGYGMDPTVSEVTAGYSFDLNLTPVPLPPAAWLLLSGLCGAGVFARKHRGVALR
jgi:hypothetical protein